MNIIIADDSAVVRAILEQNLNKIEGIRIVASVSNGRKAVAAAKEYDADVVISDVDMPDMDGIKVASVLYKELHIPVIILSENEKDKIRANMACATAFFLKPSLGGYNEAFFESLKKELVKISQSSAILKKAQQAENLANKNRVEPLSSSFKIVCIGASTGGPSAVATVLQGLGNNFSLPILYAQHLDIGADKNMVQWFCDTCPNIAVRLASDGEEALPGTVYMAPADVHLVIDYVKQNGNPVLSLSKEAPERFLRPAVNKLFRSAAQFYKNAALAVLLTGMGRDGAEGCKAVCNAGGWTIAEDKSTCAVFGMPAAAIELGAAKEVLPRNDIAHRIRELAGGGYSNGRKRAY